MALKIDTYSSFLTREMQKDIMIWGWKPRPGYELVLVKIKYGKDQNMG